MICMRLHTTQVNSNDMELITHDDIDLHKHLLSRIKDLERRVNKLESNVYNQPSLKGKEENK